MKQLIRVARGRVHGHLWPILQTAVAAIGAWYLAVKLGAHQPPTFASIAAVISLGATFGERRQRAVQLICGVMLGIVVADLIVRAIGGGLPQIGLLVVLAMVAAVVLGGGELLVSEAAVSAILVATAAPSSAGERLLEVLVGGGVALAVHALVFPPDPVLGVSRATGSVFGELGSVLRDGAAALAAGDARRAQAAQQAAGELEGRLDGLRTALLVGADTAKWAPVRRRCATDVERYRRVAEHAEHAVRNARVLTRQVLRHARGGTAPDPELAEAIRDLGLAAWELPAQFQEPWRSGDVMRLALEAAARATAAVLRQPDLALGEIAGQVRSLAIDIVKASEAGETEHGAIAEAPTEELLAGLPLPEPAIAMP
ncbi:MAG: FUSC family protein [Solirubrobacteraceae bacterium]|jgi:uncharacterized membrane protein YgaE (UPF0421/DUF939 family)